MIAPAIPVRMVLRALTILIAILARVLPAFLEPGMYVSASVIVALIFRRGSYTGSLFGENIESCQRWLVDIAAK